MLADWGTPISFSSPDPDESCAISEASCGADAASSYVPAPRSTPRSTLSPSRRVFCSTMAAEDSPTFLIRLAWSPIALVLWSASWSALALRRCLPCSPQLTHKAAVLKKTINWRELKRESAGVAEVQPCDEDENRDDSWHKNKRNERP